MTAEENLAAGEGHAAVAILTEEQKQFLATCEAEFADRYTEADQEFVPYKESVCTPPIVDPWYNKPRHNFARGRRHQNWGSRNDRGHNQGGEGGGYQRHGDRFYGHRHRPY